MICPYFGKQALWCENKVVYGRNYGRSYMCYYCKDCDAYVGCHNNTTRPLGTMANKELRSWRMKVHAAIDPIWKTGKLKRRSLYFRLSKLLGFQYHTGESDIEMCRKVLDLVPKLLSEPAIYYEKL